MRSSSFLLARASPLMMNHMAAVFKAPLSRSHSTTSTTVPPLPLSPEQPPSAEYHRHSTRYNRSSREVITLLDKGWETPTHPKPTSISDHVALNICKILRLVTDGYFSSRLVLRAVMLETIAAVPGFVAGMVHHFRSLRQLNHCLWLKALTAEAENERMHLVSWLDVLAPSPFQRFLILGAQGVFLPIYFFSYVLFPRTAHRFVAALEVEACITYTHLLEQVDAGVVPNGPCPQIAKTYWNLPADATVRDMILVIRADEYDHVIVNEHLSQSIRDNRKWLQIGGPQPCSHFDLDLHKPLGPLFEQKLTQMHDGTHHKVAPITVAGSIATAPVHPETTTKEHKQNVLNSKV